VKIERQLPHSLHWVEEKQKKYFKWLNFIPKPAADDVECPPITFARTRPSNNVLEFLWYKWNRLTREVTHFYASTSAVLEIILVVPMKVMLVLRFVCIVSPIYLGGIIRSLLVWVPPLKKTIERHSQWFGRTHNEEFTDHAMVKALEFAFVQVENFVGLSLYAHDELHHNLPPMKYTIAVLVILSAPILLVWAHYKYQDWYFDKVWSEEQESWCEGAGKETKSCCLCKCIQNPKDLSWFVPTQNEKDKKD